MPPSSINTESSYQCIRDIPQIHPVSAIAFNCALTYVAAATLHGPFKIWDISNGHEVYHELHPHANNVGALCWITFPDRTELLLTASDVILAWRYSVQQKRYLLVPSILEKSHDEICSVDVKLVENVYQICTCSPDGGIAAWEIDHMGTIRNLWSFKMGNRPVKVVFMDKNKILVFTRVGQIIFEVDAEDIKQQPIQHILPYRCLTSLAFHPRSRTIAVVNSGGVDVTSLRRLERYTRLHTAFLQQYNSENSIAFFADGKKVVVGTAAGKAQVFSIQSGACLQELRIDGHRQAQTVAIGSNNESTFIAVATSDPFALNVLRIYRPSSRPTHYHWHVVALIVAVIIIVGQLYRSGSTPHVASIQRSPIEQSEARFSNDEPSTFLDLTYSVGAPFGIEEGTDNGGDEPDDPYDEPSTFPDLTHDSTLDQSNTKGSENDRGQRDENDVDNVTKHDRHVDTRRRWCILLSVLPGC